MIKGYNNDPENRIDEEKSDRQTESGKEDVAVGTSGGYMRRYNSIGAQKHWEEKMVEEMTDRDWKIFREDHDIRVVSGKATYPLRDFNDCELNVRIVDNIRNAGVQKAYSDPDAIHHYGPVPERHDRACTHRQWKVSSLLDPSHQLSDTSSTADSGEPG
jgi:hypothetical protein